MKEEQKIKQELIKEMGNLHQRCSSLQRSLEGMFDALASMVQVKNSYTADHQRRVTHLCCAIAKK